MKTSNVYIYLVFILNILTSCETEQFETTLNISLESKIANLAITSTPIAINLKSIEDNLISSSTGIIDTIWTDEFGRFNDVISLRKISKKHFYELYLPEGQWFLPINQTADIRAGITNNVTFKIEPKWRHLITLTDTAGEFQLERAIISHSKTKDFTQNEIIQDLTLYSTRTIVASAPSFSYLFLTLAGKNRASGEYETFTYQFGTEDFGDIWINY